MFGLIVEKIDNENEDYLVKITKELTMHSIHMMKPEQENKVLNLLNDLNLNEEQGFKNKDMPEFPGYSQGLANSSVIVVEVNGEVQGFLLYGTTSNCCNVMDVYVSPEYQSNGFATQMFEYMENKIKEETWIYEVRLSVRNNNSAQELYICLGFKPYAISMFKSIKR